MNLTAAIKISKRPRSGDPMHVKSFFDANNDGVGDFAGLTQKLDYIKDLGATAIWVMPFYPLPLRDDGYDISYYRGINPAYGSLRDFKRFVQEAHERGVRVARRQGGNNGLVRRTPQLTYSGANFQHHDPRRSVRHSSLLHYGRAGSS
jgi:hypothetical protein